MITVGTAIAYLDLDTSKFSSGLKSAYGDLKGFLNDAKSGEDRLASLGSAMGKVGSMATTGLTLPIVGVGAAILKTSSDFEAGMAKVQAISGATGEDLELLKDKAKEMGTTTKFSASESAEAFQYMAMAGWKTEDMLAGIKGIMNLAAADTIELGEASDIVTDAMTAFGLAADETTTVIRDGFNVEVPNAEHFADVLAAASSNANTNVHMLGESFKYVAPTAGAMGYNIEDTAIALGLMANAGVKASRGGTSLNAVLVNMAKPTKAVDQAMEYLGLSLENADGSMASLYDIMVQLRSSMGNIRMPTEEFESAMEDLILQFEAGEITEKAYNDATDELISNAFDAEDALKAKYAATLAGKEGMAGLLAIVSASDEDFNKLTEAIKNSDGTAEDMANTMNETAEGSVTLFKSAMEGLALAFSDNFLPPFTEAVQKASAFIGQLSLMDEKTKALIVTIATIIAAIGPVLLIMSKLISAFLSIKSAIDIVWPIVTGFFTGGGGLTALLGLLANPITLIIAAIAALAYAWINDIGSIRESTQVFVDAVIEIIKWFIDLATGIWNDGLFMIVDTAKEVFAELQEAFQIAFEMFNSIIRIFGDILRGDWSQLWVDIQTLLSQALDLLISLLKAGFKLFIGVIIDIGGLIYVEGEKALKKLWEAFQSVWASLMNWFQLVKEDPVKAITGLAPKFMEAGKEWINNLMSGLKEKWEGVKSWFNETMEWIKGKLKFWEESRDQLEYNQREVNDTIEHANFGPGIPHKNGLDYVPYDGYRAILHKGERVLTAGENDAYSGRYGASQGNQTFNFYGTPPLNEKETARQFKKSQQQLGLAF